ncbi:MAG: sulfatase [Planctomycetota bacterium]|nr:sulfatase [Planctomycetota bacterium]
MLSIVTSPRLSQSILVLCWLHLSSLLFIQAASAFERPNIVFLFADDQATYSMGCYGTPGAKTPKLDQLAREGMVFDRHYDTTAICMASRVNVMTGLYEYKAGCNFDSGNLLDSHWQNSYPIQLRKAGYQTAFAGKFGFTICEKPNGKGKLPESDFDSWGGGPGQTSYQTSKNASMRKYAEEYPHSTLSYGAFGRDFIKDAATKDAPFCLSISFKAPHHPVQPDPEFDDVYKGAKFVKPANYGREHGEHFSNQSRQGRQYERFHSWNYADKYDETMALYYQQIYAIDVATGMIRKAIEEAGVSKNTVVIYSSDNGFLNGSHGYGSKVLPYEEATRVPLIVFDPRHSSSGKQLRCDALTGNVDIGATIFDLAGVDTPESMDGRSLMRLLDDPQKEIHDYLPLVNVWGPNKVHSFAVVTKQGKYVYWPYAGEGFEATEEAYDMKNDNLELHNMLGKPEYQAQVDALKRTYSKALKHWKKERVDYHGYSRFVTIFDPGKPWSAKEKLYRKK